MLQVGMLPDGELDAVAGRQGRTVDSDVAVIQVPHSLSPSSTSNPGTDVVPFVQVGLF